jgi:hypothetical protein
MSRAGQDMGRDRTGQDMGQDGIGQDGRSEEDLLLDILGIA